jgi:hypothetical protein
MEETLTTEPRTDSEYRAAMDEILAELRRLHAQMRTDRVEIERLKQEGAELKAQTRSLLASIGAVP